MSSPTNTATTDSIPAPTTATLSPSEVRAATSAPAPAPTAGTEAAKPAAEPAAAKAAKPATANDVATELDLAFCCDCTGSMGSYIKSAQDNIRGISQRIHDEKGTTTAIRYALVKYRDHPPQDKSFITEVFPFTGKLEKMKKNVDTMSASGGGDGPEAVAAALHEVDQLEWRPNATKVCVFIADAPPHGLGEANDGFPQGCPQGHDPIKTCKAMAAKGISVYAIGVEPVLSQSYKYARDFMMTVAQITEGKFLPLGKASILAEVIVNGAIEGLEMDAVWKRVEAEVTEEANAKGETLSKQEVVKRAACGVEKASASTAMRQIEVDNPYMHGYDNRNCDALMRCESLASGRAQLSASVNAQAQQQAASYAWGAQGVQAPTMQMQPQQCQRSAQQAAKRAGEWSYQM